MHKTIQDLRTEFNQETETLKSTLGEMKVSLRNPIAQQQNSKECLTYRMNQTEGKLSDFEDKIEGVDQISKEHNLFK